MDTLAFKILVVQTNPTVGDLTGNADAVIAGIKHARAFGAQMVAFPGHALGGGPLRQLLRRPAFVAEAEKQMARIAEASKGIIAILGAPFDMEPDNFEEDRGQDGAVLIQNGVQVGQFLRGARTSEGRAPTVEIVCAQELDAAGQPKGEARKFNLAISLDDEVLDTPDDFVGADFICNLAGRYFDGTCMRLQDLRTACVDMGWWLLDVNLVGAQDELIFEGGSSLMDCRGNILAQAQRFATDLMSCCLPLNSCMLVSDCPGTEGAFVSLQPVQVERVSMNEDEALDTFDEGEMPEAVEDHFKALTLGIGDYVRKNGFTDVVLGISGGVDSALVAALAVEALGSEHVHGIYMPSCYSSETSTDEAHKLCRNLNVKLLEVPIEGPRAAFTELFAPHFEGRPADTTEENLQARIRANIVMAFSNKFGWLALCTGNKSEAACGYFTLYGDAIGGLSPIKDLFKTEVYALCRYINERAGRELIPEVTITRAPSAELRPDQKDSDSLPDYESLDRILAYYLHCDFSREQIIASGFKPEDVDKAIRLTERSEFKRRQTPFGFKVSPMLFGFDRPVPLTNRYREWQ